MTLVRLYFHSAAFTGQTVGVCWCCVQLCTWSWCFANRKAIIWENRSELLRVMRLHNRRCLSCVLTLLWIACTFKFCALKILKYMIFWGGGLAYFNVFGKSIFCCVRHLFKLILIFYITDIIFSFDCLQFHSCLEITLILEKTCL